MRLVAAVAAPALLRKARRAVSAAAETDDAAKSSSSSASFMVRLQSEIPLVGPEDDARVATLRFSYCTQYLSVLE